MIKDAFAYERGAALFAAFLKQHVGRPSSKPLPIVNSSSQRACES